MLAHASAASSTMSAMTAHTALHSQHMNAFSCPDMGLPGVGNAQKCEGFDRWPCCGRYDACRLGARDISSLPISDAMPALLGDRDCEGGGGNINEASRARTTVKHMRALDR